MLHAENNYETIGGMIYCTQIRDNACECHVYGCVSPSFNTFCSKPFVYFSALDPFHLHVK